MRQSIGFRVVRFAAFWSLLGALGMGPPRVHAAPGQVNGAGVTLLQDSAETWSGLGAVNAAGGTISLLGAFDAGVDTISPAGTTAYIGQLDPIFDLSPTLPVSTDRIIQYLLGLIGDPTDLDVNADAGIDVADVIFSITQLEPGTPAGPAPANSATAVSVDTTFAWTDPGARTATFDFVLTLNNAPIATLPGLTVAEAAPAGPLAFSTAYAWQVTSLNSAGTTEGPLWSFTTENEPVPLPGPPSAPSPTDGRTGVGVGAFLQWTAGVDAATYDLFLWPTVDPQPGTPTGSDIADTSFNPDLLGETEYSWQVVSKNTGGQTPGPIWTFTTAPAP